MMCIMNRGTVFLHNKWIDNKEMPLVCIVTATRKGLIYWRQLENGQEVGGRYCFNQDEISRFVKEIVEET